MARVPTKTYEYMSVTVEDRGHLDEPSFIEALNYYGSQGWKRSEEREKGVNKMVILFERELVEDGKDHVSEVQVK